MQLSLAQHASLMFYGFFAEFTENELSEERQALLIDHALNIPEGDDKGKTRKEQIASRCQYLTDYLQIWLLTGEGVRETAGEVSIYFQTVAIVFGEFALSPSVYEPCKKLMPAPAEQAPFGPIAQNDLAFAGYPLPTPMSPEFYAYCAQPVPEQIRQERIRDLFHSKNNSGMRRVTVDG